VPTFTVCIPSYNAEKVIGDTIRSLLRQSFRDWECLVVDDASTDGTASAVAQFTDERIRFVSNDRNLGCAGNFQRCRDLAKGTYIYFLANDDVLAPNALERAYTALQSAPDVATLIRPYYWFRGEDPDQVARYTKTIDTTQDRIISIDDDDAVLRCVFDNLGQVSGLVFRNDALSAEFSPHVWTTHIQPFLMTLKEHRSVFVHDYPIAVRIDSSQSRNISSIYDPSPLWTWAHMMKLVFPGNRWRRQRRLGIDNIAGRPEGLVQVRCHSTFKNFLREAFLYVWYRPKNLFSLKYWFFALGCLVMRRRALRWTVDRYMYLYTRPETAGIMTVNDSKTFS
jgi:glycosyltransferase involved in cell wall biosynthesis